MYITVSAVFLSLGLLTLPVDGKKYKQYHVPAQYTSTLKVGLEPVHVIKLPEVEEVPFIEHRVEDVVEHAGLSEFIETSSVRMEMVLKKMKLESFAKKCLKKGSQCFRMLDCCSALCQRSSKKCV
ncbi:PREDICTED: uncharacterized protein LOC108612096 [Drosophila arizonae]|uniref:Uncharacterized protein LOC108612096 n=1 Tax=Drosophila arizonae TaxID=7263 RepID=A0ABM1NZU9_DROAR|nr:PREDICTED: uncharacterized protein LOC108612096 [Drosophila arizonae]